ncbi:MAG: hypothetical protein ACK5OC_29460, partial [Pirellula sp.]
MSEPISALARFVPTTARFALIVSLRRLGDSRWTHGKAEADAAAPVRRVGPVTERRQATRGNVAPTAAT